MLVRSMWADCEMDPNLPYTSAMCPIEKNTLCPYGGCALDVQGVWNPQRGRWGARSNPMCTGTCGLVAMTPASHAEGRQFDPGQVYLENLHTPGCPNIFFGRGTQTKMRVEVATIKASLNNFGPRSYYLALHKMLKI